MDDICQEHVCLSLLGLFKYKKSEYLELEIQDSLAKYIFLTKSWQKTQFF